MIYTVTFNPSLDYIVSVEDFKLGLTNRTSSELILPGGKGINVSTVLGNLGIENTALGFLAGFTGKEIERRLKEMGVASDFIEINEGVSRINLKLKSIDGTEINGSGPVISPEDVEKLMEKLDKLGEGDVLFLAGSIPTSMPDDMYQKIMAKLDGKGVMIVVDATRALLLNVLEYHPFLIKPNNHELGEIFDVELLTRESVVPYAKKLQEKGARNVLVSMAGEGAVLVAEDGSVYYSPETINDFFIKYALTYYDEMNGHIFEYYGQNSQAAVIKVHTDQGDYFAGIRFFVFANGVITPFIIVTAILIIFNLIFVVYIGKGLSNDIKNVNDGMDNISNSENIVFEKNLPITSNDEMADLILAFNKIQDITRNYVDQIHDNQNMLMERERLASLGQLIGGIAHNLKTPIMSISGAAEGLTDLVTEYDKSIGDKDVTEQDHHDIAKDMTSWIEKIKTYTEYMSDVITAVKGQAVNFSSTSNIHFYMDELLKNIDILMKHELKNALVSLNLINNVPSSTYINGDINCLVQVINNMISNAIQSYNGKPNRFNIKCKK